MFYNELSGVAGQSILTTNDANYNQFSFSNVQPYLPYIYWSATEYNPDPNRAWNFDNDLGYQGTFSKHIELYAWAPSATAMLPLYPCQGAVWLFGSGLVGLLGLKRRGNIG